MNQAHNPITIRTIPSKYSGVNDPNAGSPTITLLRLLLPLGTAVSRTSAEERACREANPGLPSLRTHNCHTQSVAATGGVYKGQGLIRRGLMTHDY